MPLGTSASGSELGIPWILLRGARPGPCLWINGQVHGDEINGLLAGFDFINGLDPGSLAGTVAMTTTANPFALEARRAKRRRPTRRTSTRPIPAARNGLPSERLARRAVPPVVAEQN